MKTKLLMLGAFAASLLTVTPNLPAQDARFFRIAGPAETKITALRPDGMLLWSNALAGTNYMVQTAVSLRGGTNWVDYVQIPVTNGVNTNWVIDYHPPSGMALIPAGLFQMGDTFGEGLDRELPLHSVYVSAFYMDQYLVTYSLWQTVYNWAITHGYDFDHVGSGKQLDHPVQDICWYDCVKWCNARSEMEGRVPAYYTDATQTTVYRTSNLNVDNSCVKWNSGYRLPTEAEWEKAARGGASGRRFPWGNTISWSQSNYYATGGYAYDVNRTSGCNPTFTTGSPWTSPVGYFAPNGYGLYDMAGNVWQWCWDCYGSYSSVSQIDPRGPMPTGVYWVGRGGGCLTSGAIGCRTANRVTLFRAGGVYYVGFRSVLSPSQ